MAGNTNGRISLRDTVTVISLAWAIVVTIMAVRDKGAVERSAMSVQITVLETELIKVNRKLDAMSDKLTALTTCLARVSSDQDVQCNELLYQSGRD